MIGLSVFLSCAGIGAMTWMVLAAISRGDAANEVVKRSQREHELRLLEHEKTMLLAGFVKIAIPVVTTDSCNEPVNEYEMVWRPAAQVEDAPIPIVGDQYEEEDEECAVHPLGGWLSPRPRPPEDLPDSGDPMSGGTAPGRRPEGHPVAIHGDNNPGLND